MRSVMLALRNRHLFLIDLLLLPAAALLSFALRLDAKHMQDYIPAILLYMIVGVVIKLVVFRRAGLYSRFWRYASVDELLLIAMAVGFSSLLIAALLLGLALPLAWIRCPRSIPFIDGLLTLIVVAGPRFAVRLEDQQRQRHSAGQGSAAKRVLVMGAGSAGTLIVKEMRANPELGLVPVGFVDDDVRKHNVRIHGVPVLGGRKQIAALVREHKVDQVIIAMPTAPGPAIREIVEVCSRAGVPARTVPGLHDILSGRVRVSEIRDVDIEDLLRREPVRTDTSAVEAMLRGCRVLVTGAGGSIGSELCRQIARCQPESLILLGHGENSIFGISNELRRLWPNLPVEQVIADVRDLDRLVQVFKEHRPQTVFHAAAHKHVPLMEANVAEAITNNVLGTANLLHVSEACAVGRFVLISTDKAVNPTSIMGATKRVAELLVQAAASRLGQPYVAVRFGNVLGSRGSVVPFFREQISRGGPVTVTHPEIRRYFMTIPEAVQLVLQASALGQGGEVFLLDMGEPIRIVDLARDLIQLSGLEVGRDIDIVYTGLRPGEKLFEELFLDGEEYARTQHQKVFVSRNGIHAPCCPANLEEAVAGLVALAQEGAEDLIRGKLKEIVPEYEPVPSANPVQDCRPGEASSTIGGHEVERTSIAVQKSRADLLTMGRLLMGAPLIQDLDWEAVIALAQRHGVAALLYWRLREQNAWTAGEGKGAAAGNKRPTGPWTAVPQELRTVLQEDFYATAAQSLVAERQLAEVLAALAEAGVPAIVVKGAAAGAFYPNPALRAYSDLDILVPQAKVEQAEAALNDLGYHAVKPKDWALDHAYHLPPMASDEGRLMVEVHWRLDIDEQEGVPNYAATLPVEGLWARAVPWSVDGQPALRLEAIDAMLHLCRHTVVQHRAHLGLRPLCDLAQVAAGWRSGDWEELARRAAAYGLARPVYLMLASASGLLGLTVPPETMAALRPAEPLRNDLLDRLFGLDGQPSGRVPVVVVQAGAKGTPLARLRHFLWHLFLPRNGMAVVYGVPANSPRIWLTYLWRPIDLLRRYGKGTWRALWGDPASRAAWEREAWLEWWLQGEAVQG